jgi:UPF0755 protein
MKTFLRLVIAAIIVVAGAAGFVFYRLNQPWRGFTQPVFIEFPHGASTREISTTLERRGVISSHWLFLAARALRPRATLQAGEYKFERPASPLEVYSRIVRGDIFYLELLVPEGFNMFDIAEAVGKLGTMTPEQFLTAARSSALIRDLDPDAPTLEGYLFPNKYRIYRHTTAQQLCRMMVAEFRSRWNSLQARANLHQTVTLASMVEREARRTEERPLIASVFANRLRIGMKLDCDPTTVYAALLENRYRGVIHRSDLANTSHWNTYQHPGLPPGPIANPGLSSIRAALEPAATSYLYFVAKADGSGSHSFSDSLLKHEAAVAHYQRTTRQ